jgi:hypothetical protein
LVNRSGSWASKPRLRFWAMAQFSVGGLVLRSEVA